MSFALIKNIKKRFLDKTVKIVTAMSIFNPSLLPPTEDSLPLYGNDHIRTLAEFYGKNTEVKYAGVTYTSVPLLDGDELLSEWKVLNVLCYLRKMPYLQVCKIYFMILNHQIHTRESFLKQLSY